LFLSEALLDADEKTSANAAGALGNLVRNSGELSEEIANQPVIERLVKLTLSAEIATRRIALFSLGTMAVYSATRELLMTIIEPCSITDLFHRLAEVCKTDEVLSKYLVRLKQKLKHTLQN
jgi:HEAT repeat protein